MARFRKLFTILSGSGVAQSASHSDHDHDGAYATPYDVEVSISEAMRSFVRSTIPNLIDNGSILNDIGNWYLDAGSVDSSIVFSAAQSRSIGSGSLAFTAGAAFDGRMAYRPGGSPDDLIPLNGITTTVDFACWIKSADADIFVTPTIVFYNAAHGLLSSLGQSATELGPIDASSWAECSVRDFAVPVGATHCQVKLQATSLTPTGPVYIDDIYFGSADGDVEPYPYVGPVPISANRLFNGDFELATVMWTANNEETITRETVTPITGTASLKVITPGAGSGEGVWIRSGIGNMLIVPGETLRLSFIARGAGTFNVRLFGISTLGPFVLTEQSQIFMEDFIVPTEPTPKFLSGLEFMTTTQQVVTFYLDDVSLGTPS